MQSEFPSGFGLAAIIAARESQRSVPWEGEQCFHDREISGTSAIAATAAGAPLAALPSTKRELRVPKRPTLAVESQLATKGSAR